jgi:hypothetical protein
VRERVVDLQPGEDGLDRLLDGLLDVEADDLVGLVGIVRERAGRREVGGGLCVAAGPGACAAQVWASRRPSRSARSTIVPRSPARWSAFALSITMRSIGTSSSSN